MSKIKICPACYASIDEVNTNPEIYYYVQPCLTKGIKSLELNKKSECGKFYFFKNDPTPHPIEYCVKNKSRALGLAQLMKITKLKEIEKEIGRLNKLIFEIN